MKIIFKILTLPIFLPYAFVFGGMAALVGYGDSVMDFIDWYMEK